MTITNRLEKNTILCALKVQLKRLKDEREAFISCMPFECKGAFNNEIARIRALIATFEEDINV